jgi:hypothetical protein
MRDVKYFMRAKQNKNIEVTVAAFQEQTTTVGIASLNQV